ncbi:ATP-grasp domain-containing protein [Kitasatospora cineracea]|uniref:ATP-grasp domain-containing protein n=1 Tax=Kitasatospora cineracea TaxID=88074 RepID=UPI00342C8A6E
MTDRNKNTAVVLCKWQPRLAAELMALAPDVYVILDDFDVQHLRPDESVLAGARQVYHVSSFDSIEELANVAVDLTLRGVEVGRIVSHTEFSQYGAGYLELLLGAGRDAAPTDPLRHAAHRDKRLMKQRVRAAGAATAEYRSLPATGDARAAERVAAELAFPIVLKPASGFGTMSTVKVERPDDLPAVLTDFSFEPLLRSRQLIAEEFVHGQEVCVDACWSDGEALTFVVHAYHETRLGLTDRQRPAVGGADGSRVLPEADHPELHAALRALHDKVNLGLGIRHGTTHLEAFVGPDGTPVFSEVASRVGGGWIPRLLSAQLGRDVWENLARLSVTGHCPPARPVRPYVGAVHIGPSRPGVITAMPGDGELAAHPGVLDWQRVRRVGSRVTMAHPSEWCLFLVLGADSADEYEQLRHEVAERFRIETEEADDVRA